MLLALAAENGLLEFLRVLDNHCRVLGGNLVQCIPEFGLVCLDLGLDRSAVFRCRELDVLVNDTCTRLGKGDIGLSGTQLHCTADISGHHVGNLFLLGTCHSIDCGDTLPVAGSGILEIHALVEFTAHDLEVRNFSEMRLDVCLVYEKGSRSVLLADDFLSFPCQCLRNYR